MMPDTLISLIAGGLTALIVALIAIPCLAAIAPRLGLADHSHGHKLHDGQVPTVGGIAIFLGFIAGLAATGQWFGDHLPFLAAVGLLLVVGIVDDRHMLPAWVRFAAQIAAASIMVLWGGVRVESLGDLTGGGPILLGDWAMPFTVFGVVGVINAVNMIDGIDGLAGSLLLSVLAALVILAGLHGADGLTASMVVLIFAILAFLLFNHPHLRGRKRTRVFLGDAGTLFLGLALAWCLVDLTQGAESVIRPVSALWLLLIPIYDTITVMLRRIAYRRSPFTPDREHVHHAMMAVGMNPPAVLAVLSVAQVAIIGMILFTEHSQTAEWLLFLAFVAMSVMYLAALSLFWHYRSAGDPGKQTGHETRHGSRSPLQGL